MIEFDGAAFFRRNRPGPRVDLPARRRGVGYVMQDYALFPHMTVLENVMFPLRGAPDREARALALLERVSVAHLAHERPGSLSGGQQQRVVIARALAANGGLLLLDEPFAALDGPIRERLQADLRTLQRELRLVMILVTHRLEDAFALGDRIAVLRAGRLEQVGPIEDVVRRPATRGVAEIMGIRNLLRAHRILDLPGARRWAELGARLPRYRIAPTGELAEWATPAGPLDQTDRHTHRHASHLFPFWYEGDPAFADPTLRAAAVRAIRARLAWWRSAASDEMAFGLVQLGLAAANLGLATEAATTLELMATRYWRPTLVSTHNRGALFNTDICGGFPAVVAAMLLRSREGRCDLLPALPPAWPEGEARGLCGRGGVLVDHLEWTPTRMRARLRARHTTRVRIGLPDGATRVVTLDPDQAVDVTAPLTLHQ
ncbi:MAG: hypothetical protein CW348_00205 [Thermobifida sp.]|nr:hypothetical protein [Thermobifida sp.]